MPSELVDADPERDADLEASRANLRFLAENMPRMREEHGGCFVVVSDESVVAAEETSDAAWEAAREQGVDLARSVMQFVPEPGRAYFF